MYNIIRSSCSLEYCHYIYTRAIAICCRKKPVNFPLIPLKGNVRGLGALTTYSGCVEQVYMIGACSIFNLKITYDQEVYASN